jgi:hypothetical protein
VREKKINILLIYFSFFFLKLSSKTWKGVVKKNKFELPAHHENKIGVGANSLTNRPTLFLDDQQSTASNSKAPARYQSESFKQSKF